MTETERGKERKDETDGTLVVACGCLWLPVLALPAYLPIWWDAKKMLHATFLSRVWTNEVVNAGKTKGGEIGKRATLPSNIENFERHRVWPRPDFSAEKQRDRRVMKEAKETYLLAKLTTFPSTRLCTLPISILVDRSVKSFSYHALLLLLSHSLSLSLPLLATLFFSLLLYSSCLCLSLLRASTLWRRVYAKVSTRRWSNVYMCTGTKFKTCYATLLGG